MTVLAQRAYEKNVNILWNEAKIFKKVQDHKDLFITEKIEILKAKQNEIVVNSQLADNTSKAWKYIINKCNNHPF